MNVLRVITTMNPEYGGPTQGIRNIIPALEAIGIHNEVVCFDDPTSSFLSADSFKIHALGQGKGSYFYNAHLTSWLDQNLGQFDVVIIHGLWQYNSYGTYVSWKKYKKKNKKAPKIFIMPHGMLDPYFQKAKERKLKAIRNYIFYALIEKQVINNADGVLFTCKQELLLAQQTFTPYAPKSELNIGYGIQAPPTHTSEMDERFFLKFPELKGKEFLLFLSRIHHKKGLDMLIEAYRALAGESSLPELVIAGPGLDTEYGQQLLIQAKDTSAIHFIGMIKGDYKWGAFYNCQAFVLPSHQENFGIAIVEAMACKKPVLITNKVNIWREIKDADGGFVENDDFDGTIKLISKWQQLTPEQKSAKGKNAYSAYQTHFSIEQASLKFKEVMDHVKRQ